MSATRSRPPTEDAARQVSFDANGDIAQRVVAVFQVKHDPNYPVDDLVHQYKYVGVAPSDNA